jgi:hypothetical protein
MARVGTSVVALADCRGVRDQANDGTQAAQVAGSGGGRVRFGGLKSAGDGTVATYAMPREFADTDSFRLAGLWCVSSV